MECYYYFRNIRDHEQVGKLCTKEDATLYFVGLQHRLEQRYVILQVPQNTRKASSIQHQKPQRFFFMP